MAKIRLQAKTREEPSRDDFDEGESERRHRDKFVPRSRIVKMSQAVIVAGIKQRR